MGGKKKIIAGLLLGLIFLTTGCLAILENNEEDDLVWRTYSTSTFGIKYPPEWLYLEGDYSSYSENFIYSEDLDEKINESEELESWSGIIFRESTDSDAAVFAVVDLEANTDLEGPGIYFDESAVEGMFGGEGITIEGPNPVTVGGRSAYEYILTNNNVNAKFSMVFTVKQHHAFILFYGAGKDIYSSKASLFEEMRSSFSFNY